jgi:NAD(P)H dehydrogenase (quinone)
MNVLWVFAHPEQHSLNGALKEVGLAALHDLGHECRVSDLYAMRWKAAVDAGDFTHHEPEERLVVTTTSHRAHVNGTLSPDITAEQAKLRWADTVVLQFPLWWYGMPAILKGWFDRVFVKGFAYGVTDPEHPGRTLRYGEGTLAGKRAFTIITTGSPPAPLASRGINGQLDLILFPLLHGTLWYSGMSVLPPFTVFGADRLSERQYEDYVTLLRQRLETIEDIAPMPFRRQNAGDYDEDLLLRPDLAPGETGLGIHYTWDDETEVQPMALTHTRL